MSKEKKHINSVSGDYSNKKIDDINSSVQKTSYIENLKQIYLPDSKFNYVPSEDNIEHANNLNSRNQNLVTEAMVTKNNATSFNNNEKDANLE